jgi:hypothetical protein
LAVGPAVVLLNAPDNLRGAYVFRLGLPQAVAGFIHSQKVREVTVFATHSVGSVHDELAIEREDAVPGKCSVRLLNETQWFLEVRGMKRWNRESATSRFVFEWKDLPPNTDVMYYSAGGVRRLPMGCA